MKQRNRIEDRIIRFRSDLMTEMPFYGQLLSHFDIAENRSVPSAGTDGRTIYYNKAFFRDLSRGACNYVLMHELLHTILLHPHRAKDKHMRIWNVSADYVVNGLLDALIRSCAYNDLKMPFEKPPCGCFMENYYGESVEQLYQGIVEGNRKNLLKIKYVVVIDPDGEKKIQRISEKDLDLLSGLPQEELDRLAEQIEAWIEEAAKTWSNDPSSEIMRGVLHLVNRKKLLPWKTILKRYLREYETMEISYDHPERKYLHMDLILPGEGRDTEESTLENVWVFIDSSGSISGDDTCRFITELQHICRQFHAKINIGYWDTEMHEIYKDVSADSILSAVPHYLGGTDAKAVYRYLDENKVRASVIMILTDGYFAPVPLQMTKHYRDKTIVVLSEYGTKPRHDLGKIARL